MSNNDLILEYVKTGEFESLKTSLAGLSAAEINDIKDWAGDGLLSNACWFGHFNIVEYLLELGLDINVKNPSGTTPLHRACYKCDFEITKLLCDKGADYNSMDRVI